MSLANIVLYGNLGRDPETRYTKAGAMFLEFSMAVTKRRNNEESTNWYRVTVWGKQAEALEGLAQGGALTKGASVIVLGDLTVRDYEKDGTPRYSLDVNANSVQLAGGRGKQAEADEDSLPF